MDDGIDKQGENEDEKEVQEGDEEQSGDVEEGVKAKEIRQPHQPSRLEIEEHELTHVPFREWCVHCCKGKSRNNAHKTNKDKQEEDAENAVTTVSMDYMYLNDKAEKYPIIAITDRKTKAVMAHMVQCKGIKDDWAVRKVLLDIEDFGYAGAKIVIKNDQEPAMVDFQRKIMENRKAETVPKNSQVGESQANGEAENAIKRLQEQIRTIKDDLEAKTGLDIEMNHLVMPWLIEWAGVVLNRYMVYKDGHTAYRNITGKSSKRPVANFGEKVLYMPLKTERLKMDKVDAKMKEGLWLGIKHRSDEAIIGTPGGVVKARTIRRLPKDKRWDQALINSFRGTPRRPIPGVESDHIPTDEQTNFEPGAGEDEAIVANPKKEQAKMNVAREEEAPRRMYITKAVIGKYGKTIGCPGCVAVETGKYAVHTRECHDRLREEMSKSEGGRRKLEEEQRRVARRFDIGFEKAIEKELQKNPGIRKEVEEYNETIEQINKRQRGGATSSSSAATSAAAATAAASSTATSPPNTLPTGDVDMQDSGDKRGVENSGEEPVDKKHKTDMMNVEGNVDLSEVYSPPRITTVARRLGLRPGCSLDLTTTDENGKPWDFDSLEMRNKAIHKIAAEKPFVLITSPMCTDFSIMMNANWKKLGPEEKQKRMNRARMHLRFACALHMLQHKAGRYFVHEHPRAASSWTEQCIADVVRKTGANFTHLDQCMFGLVTTDDDGNTLPAKKATTLMSNMPAIQVCMSRKCDRNHKHAVLAGGRRTKDAQVYPDKLCVEIVKAVKKQKEWDAKGVKPIAFLYNMNGQEKNNFKIPEEEPECDDTNNNLEVAWDDVSGKYLNPDEVRKARAAEIEYYRKMGVYKKVPITECLAKTGQRPIGVRWVDVDKGDRDRPNYRSRLVAKQYRGQKDDDLYAATPPIEALRIVVSAATTGNKEKVVMVNDVSRAYMYAMCEEDIYVELCAEDQEPGEEHMCGKLVKAMYGTRPAARMWQREVAKTLTEAEFSAGRTSPCLFYHSTRDVVALVHGDDFVSAGSPEDLEWLRTVLAKRYCIKTTIIGEQAKFNKHVRVLNRLLRWHCGVGITIEPDPRHVEILLEDTGAKNERALTVTGEKSSDRETKGENVDVLDPKEVTKFRACIARMNYLAIDRPDIMFAVKELARRMSAPSIEDQEKMCRLARYLKGKPRNVAWYQYQDDQDTVEVFTDSDWAGCRSTRRSTSGGCIMIGTHFIKAWSKTQATRALSSAEAELYAIVKATAEGMGVQSILKDFGRKAKVHLMADASAALGIVRRKGLGRMRHLDTDLLWVQDVHEGKKVGFHKITGTQNPADLLTKYLGAGEVEKHVKKLYIDYPSEKEDQNLTIHGLCFGI